VIDEFGEWANLGTEKPNYSDWIPFGINSQKPTQVFRVTFVNYDNQRLACAVRIDAHLQGVSSFSRIQSRKIYYHPTPQIFELPLPDEISIKDFQMSLSVKKIGFRGQGRVTRSPDSNPFLIQLEALVLPVGYYQQGGITAPVESFQDDGDYLAYVQENLVI
jgi:hypothetical protein